MAGLTVVRPGLFTTIQDLGRWGFQSRGVPVSGAMDRYSHRLANRLVGEVDTAATLEVTMTGPEIKWEGDVTFAVTGAIFDLSLDGVPIEMNAAVEGSAGSVLRFGERRRGARAYISVAGGVGGAEVLGSRSTHVLTRMGGLDGRALRAGDRIPTLQEKGTGTFLQKGSRPLFLPQGGAQLRVIPGEATAFAHLTGRRWQVSPESNRMGYRLDGGAGEGPVGDAISHAVPTGAIQVPPSGRPIMLMADHATTGGYCIGATVITADLSAAAQLAPGDWVEFQSCSLEEADRLLGEQEAALAR